MDPLVAVTNTTPIIALTGVHQLRLLDLLFDRVIVPIDVWLELTALPDAPEPPAVLALEKAVFIPAPPAPPEAQQLDPGERAAISIAHSLPSAWALIDEKAGRDVASRLGLTVKGTLGILVEAKRRGFVPELRSLIDDMIANGCRISRALVALVLSSVGE